MKNLILLLLLCYNITYSQVYPDVFSENPLEIDLNVNGSFGELRYNHFHSGIDFGTNRKTSIAIIAPKDGEIVRIQINEKGYGKTLYIKHPNGYTTVYAHLEAYGRKIQDFVKKNQYKEQKYAIEIFPLKNELVVKKGDLIGYVGNTGSSSGPHLHYEIRDTQTEEIINPLLFGLGSKINDFEKPIINSLITYPISENSVVNGMNSALILSLTKQSNGVYIAEKVNAKGSIGFGVNTYDVMNNRYSKNGIYKIESFLNGTKNFEVIFDRFSFDETRKINLFIDYERLSQTKERVQKLFKSVNYDLSLIKLIKNNGEIEITEDDNFNYKIVISDFHENKTEINIPISYSSNEGITKSKNENRNLKKIDSKRDYILTEENGTIEWSALTFYEDCELDIQFSENEIKLHKDIIPLDKNITIKFDLTNSKTNIEKAFIGLENKNNISYFHSWKKDSLISIRTKTLGTYKVIEDIEKPEINPISKLENNKFNVNDVLVFEVVDKISGIKEINGYINDQWVLFEYEYKNNQITHNLNDGIAKKGLNKLKIIVTDHVGNNITFESNFELN